MTVQKSVLFSFQRGPQKPKSSYALCSRDTGLNSLMDTSYARHTTDTDKLVCFRIYSNSKPMGGTRAAMCGGSKLGSSGRLCTNLRSSMACMGLRMSLYFQYGSFLCGRMQAVM